MLFGPTPPGTGSVGEIFLAEMIRQVDIDQICCYAAWSRNYAVRVEAEDMRELRIKYRELPEERLLKKNSSSQAHARHWAELDSIVEDAIAFGKENRVEVLMACMVSPSVVRMTQRIADGLNARLACLIWDPPESTMQLMGFDTAMYEAVIADYRGCIRRADKLAVASYGMASDILLKFGKKANVLVRGATGRLPLRQTKDPSRFTIGFCGSIYSTDAFVAFLEALHDHKWLVNGKPVTFKILSNSFVVPVNAAGHHADLRFLGHRSLQETQSIMSECDALYLPYWFEQSYEQSVRNCFPDKMVTYLCAGGPVFFHGPEDSSVTRFMERFDVGVRCHSLESKTIMRALESIAADDTQRAKFYAAGTAAIEEELNMDVFRSRVRDFFCASQVLETIA